MSETPETLAETFAKPETLMRVPVGMASPLWGIFAGAAVSGAAWWWMTRWVQPQNLEAMFGAMAESPMASMAKAAAQPMLKAAEAAVEVAVEAEQTSVDIAETEVASLEAAVEPPVLETPVGGESAPIGPAAAAASEPKAAPEPTALPKARARKVETKPE